MNRAVLIAAILVNTSVAMLYAQHQISGTVKDRAGGSPVPYATAALLRPDSSAITGVMTSDEGKFVIQNVATGNYLLQVSFIEYVNTSDTGSSATLFTKSFNEQIAGLIIISIVWIFLRKVLKVLK